MQRPQIHALGPASLVACSRARTGSLWGEYSRKSVQQVAYAVVDGVTASAILMYRCKCQQPVAPKHRAYLRDWSWG